MTAAIHTAPLNSQELAPEVIGPDGPTTQTSVAVRVLIAYINRRLGLPVPESDEDLPEFYRRDSGLCLVKDGKERDVYYMTAPTGCSCPARHRKPAEPCEHSRRFFPVEEVKAVEKVEA